MADVVDIDRSELDEEADRFGGYPHPREMLVYHGPPETERLLLDAYRSGRMHHGWLFAGPEGIGKAVLAYRFARFILANPDPASERVRQATDLSVAESHPATRQVARLSHPDLAVIRRGFAKDGKALRLETAVDDVRDGLAVFRTTSGSGGWRIVIVDSADDLNRNSANALLKVLEEPPQKALLILIAQRPGSLLPTIRSRCRTMRFGPLATGDVAKVVASVADVDAAAARDAAQEAGGSVRAALSALDPDRRALREAVANAFADRDGRGAQALADASPGGPTRTPSRRFWTLSRRDCAPESRMAARRGRLPHVPSYGRS